MGVRLLQTYMERYVKNGIHDVDIRQEIEEFKRTHNGAEPLIVIDLLTIFNLIFTNNHELMLGGRYRIYRERAADFFGAIKSLGVKLVFFTDGPARPEKLLTCLSRRKKNYENAIKALNVVYSGLDLSCNLDNIDVSKPLPFASQLKQIASQFGEVYISVLNECDAELADYATANNAFAIISNDTDFLVFEGKWRYWSGTRLNISSLCTVEFNREALRRTLRLGSKEMALLATMSGNDIVPYDSVKNFHRMLKCGNSTGYKHNYRKREHGGLQFQAVANEIRSLRLDPESISNEQINAIAKLIFSGSMQQPKADLVKSSLRFYKYSELVRDHKSEILSLTSKADQLFNYILLADIEYIVQLYNFDLSKTDFKSYFHLISPLIQRIMGILLKNEPSPVTRVFYSKLSHADDYEKIYLAPEYPPTEIPALKDLLFCEVGKNPSLDETRLELMCWLISPNLNPDIIKRLPVDNAANSLTMLYLVEMEQISVDEADCLLLACNCPNDVERSLKLSDCIKINERDCRIAFLFTSIQRHIKNCFYAVGWDKFRQLMTFDGLYFHHLRKKWNPAVSASLLSDYGSLRIYAS